NMKKHLTLISHYLYSWLHDSASPTVPRHFPGDWGPPLLTSSIRLYRKNPTVQHASDTCPSSLINKPVTCVYAFFPSISRTTAHANNGARVVSGKVPSSSLSLKTATHPSAGIIWSIERFASLILDITASFSCIQTVYRNFWEYRLFLWARGCVRSDPRGLTNLWILREHTQCSEVVLHHCTPSDH